MIERNDGGPAFPSLDKGEAWPKRDSDSYRLDFECYGGMSLRDYFAAKAMNGLLVQINGQTLEYNAKLAYKIADAMLKEREK